ncbi:MAG: ABC transporter ATP-binding protein [Dehalococcoidia bacterium]
MPKSLTEAMPAPANHGDCLVLRHVALAYGSTVVLRGLNADIPRAEMVSIVGPNGSGKSTLLKSIAGLLPIVEGTVTLFDEPIRRVRHRISYVPQREEVDWTFPVSVRDVVAMGRHAVKGWIAPLRADDHERIAEAMRRLDIEDLADRQIGALSGGQQRRAFLARAIAQDADLFLLDEPMGGVDAATHDRILELFDEWRSHGKIVLQATHTTIHGGSMIVLRTTRDQVIEEHMLHHADEAGAHHD